MRSTRDFNRIAQKPIEGVSMVYSWDKAAANTASRRTTQYFEMFGSRGIYKDGWIASVPPWNPPWNVTLAPPPPDVMNGFPRWQLYNLNADWTQANDLAARMPDKLRDLQEAWTMEATKHQVFPLDDAVLTRFLAPKPNYNAERTVFTYTGELSNVLLSSAGNAPSLLNRSYTITADVEVPAGGGEGMLVTDGGRFAGYGFYLLKGKPVFTWQLDDDERVKWQGKDALAPGKHLLEFDWKYDWLCGGASNLQRSNRSPSRVIMQPSRPARFRRSDPAGSASTKWGAKFLPFQYRNGARLPFSTPNEAPLNLSI